MRDCGRVEICRQCVSCAHLVHCYACSVWPEDVPRNHRARAIHSYYEVVVEHVESRPAGAVITRPDVCRALGGGPFLWGVVRRVFSDMRAHGLLTCVRYDVTGRRCFGYVRAPRPNESWGEM